MRAAFLIASVQSTPYRIRMRLSAKTLKLMEEAYFVDCYAIVFEGDPDRGCRAILINAIEILNRLHRSGGTGQTRTDGPRVLS